MSSSPSPAPEVALSPSLGSRALGGFGASILGGAVLGIAAWWTDQLGFPWTAFIPANAIGAWLGVAFLLGSTARTIPTGALRGLIGIVSAIAAYYLLNRLFGEGYRASGASHAATVWGAAALIAGPVMGFAGATWRHGRGWPRGVAVAMLGAALIAEGIVFGAERLRYLDEIGTDPGAVVGAIEALLGLALPAFLLRRGERLAGYVALAMFTLVAVVALGPLVSVLRALADRF